MAEEIATMKDIELKFEEYAKFVRDVLRPDYQICRNLEQDIRNEIKECSDLILRIKNELVHDKKNDDEDTKTMIMDVDLGHNKVSCRAIVDTSASKNQNIIFVHVGMGFHVEYTWDEAVSYVQKRIEYLQRIKLPHRIQKTKHVLSHIQSSEQILDELSQELLRMKQSTSYS
jgi:prefoldin subunit 5